MELWSKKLIGPKPWLDKRGCLLPKKELKKASKKWSRETWFFYLKSLQTSLKENLGQRSDRAALLTKYVTSEGDEQASTFHDFYEHKNNDYYHSLDLTKIIREEAKKESLPIEEVAPDDEPGIHQTTNSLLEEAEELDLQWEVENAMKVLNDNERLVLWHLFWEGRSERFIANLMKKSRRTIRTWKMRAFHKLRPVLSPIFLIYERRSVLRRQKPLPKSYPRPIQAQNFQ